MLITLKAARTNKELSQKQAAELLGISVETLSKYEAGKNFPTVPTVKKIEKLYDVRYDDIDFLIDVPVE